MDLCNFFALKHHKFLNMGEEGQEGAGVCNKGQRFARWRLEMS